MDHHHHHLPHGTYVRKSTAAIRALLEEMMVQHFAGSPTTSIGLGKTASAICKLSGIPNPALFRVILRRTMAALVSHPQLVETNGYHMMACVIWAFCFLSPEALVRSLARLYHQTSRTCECITIGEVKDMLLDTMSNDRKKAKSKLDMCSLTHIQGLIDYHNAVSYLSPEYRRIMSEIRVNNSFDDATLQDNVTVPEDVFVRYFARKHPRSLWPVFMIQKQLRHVYLGDEYWKRALAASGGSNCEVSAVPSTEGDIVKGRDINSFFCVNCCSVSPPSQAKLELVSCLINVLNSCDEVSRGVEAGVDLSCLYLEQKIETRSVRQARKKLDPHPSYGEAWHSIPDNAYSEAAAPVAAEKVPLHSLSTTESKIPSL